MANTVTLTLKINDNGDLALVSKEAKKTAGAIKGVDEATKKANKSQNHYNRGAKGVGQSGLSASKGFSKMRDSMTGSNGLVGAYATLAANVFALTAAFGALSRASALQQLEKALVATGNAAGANLPYLAKQLRDVTDAAISTEQAMRATAIAVSAGFSSAQLIKLTKVAKGASIALGRDMGDALDRLVRGTAKLEPEILDELGIMVRLDEASATYAATLGKTANELTRFEKQQAFLNATILEGEKKFETILDLVAPDPYQKLGAAFQDVTKDIINFVNYGLKPVAQFLSDFPTALYGGIILFGSTIIKQVLPALGQMASGQLMAGKAAASAAVVAARAVETNYVRAANRTKAAFITVPASMEGMRAAATSGTLSLKQLQAMVVTLTKSEAMRFAVLEGGNAATFTQRNIELGQVSELLVATKAQIALEKTRGVTGAAAHNLINKSRSSKLQGKLYNKIDSSGPIKGFKIAIEGSKRQAKQVGRATGAMGKFTASMNVAGKSAGLMGRAFLNIIPGIGQLLFFGSMLLPLFGDLFKKSKLKETIEEVIESFDSFATASQQLTNYLNGVRTAEEKFTAILKVRVGIMDQISSGMQRIMEQDAAVHSEKLAEATTRVVEAQERLQKSQGKVNFTMLGSFTYTNGLANAMKNLVQVTADSEVFNKKAAAGVIAQSIARLSLTKNTKLYAFELKALEKIQSDLNNPDKDMTSDQFTDRVAAAAKPSSDLQASIAEASDYSRKFEDQMVKATKKSSGELGELYDNVMGVSTALQTAADNATTLELVEEAAAAVTDEMREQSKHLWAALGITEITGLAEKDRFKRAAVEIAKNNKAMVVQAALSKNLSNESKRYGKFSKENAVFKEFELTLAEEALQASLTALDAKIANARVENKGLTDSNAILAMLVQREDLERKITDHGDDSNLINQARIKGEQKLLKLKMKGAKMSRDLLAIQQGIAKAALITARAQAGSNVEKDDELKVLKAAMKDKSPEQLAAKEQTANAKTRIRLEYELLDLQFALEESRMKRLLDEKGITDKKARAEALAGIQAARTAINGTGTKGGPAGLKSQALSLEDAKAQAKITADTNRETLLTEQIKREKLGLRIEQTEQYSALLESIGLEELSRQYKLNSLSMAQGQIEEDLLKLEDGSIAKIKKKIELQDILNQKVAIERDRRMKVLDALSTGNSGIGSAAIEAGMNNEVAKTAADKAAADNAILQGSSTATDADKAAGQEAADAAKFQQTKTGLAGTSQVLDAAAEGMRALGPEGELMATVMEGASTMTTVMVAAFEEMGREGVTTSEKIQAGLAVAGSMISTLGSISKAASDQRVRGLDSEIEAEKKRDGSSKQSLAKISALEKKKDNEKRKQFNMNKKMQMALTVINTAQAAMGAYASMSSIPWIGPVVAGIAAAGIVAMGAMQLSTIASTSYQSSGSVGAGAGPSSVSIGARSSTVDMAKGNNAGGELAYARGASGQGGMTDFTPAFTGAKYRASGGETAGFMVGEQGPEMFIPDRAGRIAPADETARMNNAPTNVNFSIQAIDSTGVEELLMNQRGNIITMIREAANSHGEFFLESVTELTQENQR